MNCASKAAACQAHYSTYKKLPQYRLSQPFLQSDNYRNFMLNFYIFQLAVPTQSDYIHVWCHVFCQHHQGAAQNMVSSPKSPIN